VTILLIGCKSRIAGESDASRDLVPPDTLSDSNDAKASDSEEPLADAAPVDAPAREDSDQPPAEVENSEDVEAEDAISDSEAPGDDVDATPAEDLTPPKEVTEGPPNIGPAIPVNEPVQYTTGDLSLAVHDSGRVSVLWSAKKIFSDPMTLSLSWSDPEVTAFMGTIPVATFDQSSSSPGPDLAVQGEEYMMTWRQKSADNSALEIVFRRATIDQLSDPTIASPDVIVTSTAISGGLNRPYLLRLTLQKFFVFWQRKVTLEMATSTDSGQSFSPASPVTPANFVAQRSEAAFIKPGRLLVAFHGRPLGQSSNRIFVTWSDDMGAVFSPPKEVTTAAQIGKALLPTLTYAGSGKLHLGWHVEAADASVVGWMSQSKDGELWNAPVEAPGVNAELAVRAGKGSTLYVSGWDKKETQGGIPLFVASPNAGKTWWPAEALPTDPKIIIMSHDVAADRKKGMLHVAWWQIHKGGVTKMTMKLTTIGKEEN
jgi:hypothetical protein